MKKDSRNSLHVYLGEEKEQHLIVFPKVNWREFSWENSAWMREIAEKAVRRICEDTSIYNVSWAWDTVPTPCVSNEEPQEVYRTKEFLDYLKMYIQSECAHIANSMFNDSYKILIQACLSGHSNLYDRGTSIGKLKPLYWLVHLFAERLHYHNGPVDRGAWIMPDGSYIVVESSSHRIFVEEFCGYKESDKEKEWVKISLGYAYVHTYMTKAQWNCLKTLCDEHDIRFKTDWAGSGYER